CLILIRTCDHDSTDVVSTTTLYITKYLTFYRVFVLHSDLQAAGRFLLQDDPKSRWEKAMDQFWNHVSKVEEMRDIIKATQLGRELDTLISDTMMELQMYKDDLHSKLGPYAQDTAKRFNEDLQLLASKLRTHLEDARDRVSEYTEELRTIVEQNADEVKNRVNTIA
ncbi:apolipoprotein Eb-like, partial [Carassius carassius]|uniref:apolipoprotein Eb-like n=1 Tax=Carassius carassius TaxID=217509 RepID=UPI0028696E7A